jgi:hypothetical protein
VAGIHRRKDRLRGWWHGLTLRTPARGQQSGELRAHSPLLPVRDARARLVRRVNYRAAQTHPDDDLRIRLVPGELRAWDFADEYP